MQSRGSSVLFALSIRHITSINCPLHATCCLPSPSTAKAVSSNQKSRLGTVVIDSQPAWHTSLGAIAKGNRLIQDTFRLWQGLTVSFYDPQPAGQQASKRTAGEAAYWLTLHDGAGRSMMGAGHSIDEGRAQHAGGGPYDRGRGTA